MVEATVPFKEHPSKCRPLSRRTWDRYIRGEGEGEGREGRSVIPNFYRD